MPFRNFNYIQKVSDFPAVYAGKNPVKELDYCLVLGQRIYFRAPSVGGDLAQS